MGSEVWPSRTTSPTKRCSEREPADSLRDKPNVIGGWLPSLTSPLGPFTLRPFTLREITPEKTMKPLQITLFIIANIIFITQSGRDVHQLIWGSEPSILDQFDPEKTKARSEKNTAVLVNEYGNVNAQILGIEKGKKWKEVQDVRQA